MLERLTVGHGTELFDVDGSFDAVVGVQLLPIRSHAAPESRLVSEFARAARDRGMLTLVGECVDLAEADLPYAPILGALRPVVRDRREPELITLFGVARGELARLLPELGEPTSLGLTARETEVLGLIANGLTNKQIAATLFISEKTAEHHVSRILGKLGVDTRTAAAALAHRLELSRTRPA